MVAKCNCEKATMCEKKTWREIVQEMDIDYGMFLFLVGSIFGWTIELLYRSLNKGELNVPGFLIGPYCPIYGCGALLTHYVCYHKNLFVAFLRIVALASLLEYVVSFLFERAFGELLWNYSNLPFSIGGRVNLMFSLVWGGMGVLAIAFVRKRIREFYEKHEVWLLQSVRLWLMVMVLDSVASIAYRI